MFVTVPSPKTIDSCEDICDNCWCQLECYSFECNDEQQIHQIAPFLGRPIPHNCENSTTVEIRYNSPDDEFYSDPYFFFTESDNTFPQWLMNIVEEYVNHNGAIPVNTNSGSHCDGNYYCRLCTIPFREHDDDAEYGTYDYDDPVVNDSLIAYFQPLLNALYFNGIHLILHHVAEEDDHRCTGISGGPLNREWYLTEKIDMSVDNITVNLEGISVLV